MNKVFDYNGHMVSTSKAVKNLRTVKKVVSIDSADRDTSHYYTNGDFVIYLPRQYSNVVSVRLMSGEFPPLTPIVIQPNSPTVSSGGAVIHSYLNGPNASSAKWSSDTAVSIADTFYFFVDVEGLNYSDELSVAGNRSGYRDSFLAKIPAIVNGAFIEYNDHSAQENITRFTPAIGTLDRLHIRVRTHTQQGNVGFMYWTSDGAVANNNRTVDFTLSLEIEMLENVFDDFSTMETRLSDRG